VRSLPTRRAASLTGLLVGVALGLLYTWVINPVEIVNTYPALLRTDLRWDWVRLAALSYVVNDDLEQARTRLEGLRYEDVSGAIQALIEDYAAAGLPADTMRRLTTLAEALDVHTPAMLVYLHTPASSSPTPIHTPPPTTTPTSSPTPTPSPTPIPLSTSTSTPNPSQTPTPPTLSPLSTPTPEPTVPSPTPTPTPPLLVRLQLARKDSSCQPTQAGRIEVVVKDEHGDEVPGVTVWLTWPGGADRAVTGLKSQGGAGYADFAVEKGVNYTLSVGELGRPLVTNLRIASCEPEGGRQDDNEEKAEEPWTSSWRILLEPPPIETEE